VKKSFVFRLGGDVRFNSLGFVREKFANRRRKEGRHKVFCAERTLKGWVALKPFGGKTPRHGWEVKRDRRRKSQHGRMKRQFGMCGCWGLVDRGAGIAGKKEGHQDGCKRRP